MTAGNKFRLCQFTDHALNQREYFKITFKLNLQTKMSPMQWDQIQMKTTIPLKPIVLDSRYGLQGISSKILIAPKKGDSDVGDLMMVTIHGCW